VDAQPIIDQGAGLHFDGHWRDDPEMKPGRCQHMQIAGVGEKIEKLGWRQRQPDYAFKSPDFHRCLNLAARLHDPTVIVILMSYPTDFRRRSTPDSGGRNGDTARDLPGIRELAGHLLIGRFRLNTKRRCRTDQL